MSTRGPKPKQIVNTKWSPNLSYAIGLLVTDGCLQNDGLMIDLTSKDLDQLENYKKCLGIDTKIGKKKSSDGFVSYRVQFKNRIFYDFLLSIGLTQRKSKTISTLKIPLEFFFDFLRGCFDGDGCTYSYWDKRWKSSFMFYIEFCSASRKFLSWLRKNIENQLGLKGHITTAGRGGTLYQLKYAKKEGLVLVRRMYMQPNSVYLERKKLKIDQALGTINAHKQ